jgi:hypothetical protein
MWSAMAPLHRRQFRRFPRRIWTTTWVFVRPYDGRIFSTIAKFVYPA